MSFDLQRLGWYVVEVLRTLARMWLVLLLIAILLVIACFWVEIDPAHEYSLGAGVLHGFFAIQNWILSWFTEREFWAPSNTGRGYTAGFYIGFMVIPFLSRNIIRAVLFILRDRYSKVT